MGPCEVRELLWSIKTVMNLTIKPRLATDKKFCNKSKNLKQTWNIFLDLSMKTFLLLVSSQSFKFICIGYLGNFLFLLQKSNEKLGKVSYSLALYCDFLCKQFAAILIEIKYEFQGAFEFRLGSFFEKK